MKIYNVPLKLNYRSALKKATAELSKWELSYYNTESGEDFAQVKRYSLLISYIIERMKNESRNKG